MENNVKNTDPISICDALERMKKEKAQQELIDKMRNDSRYEYLTDMLGLEFVENY